MRHLMLCVALCAVIAAGAAEDVVILYDGEAQLGASVVAGPWGEAGPQEATGVGKPVEFAPGKYGLLLRSTGRYQGLRVDLRAGMAGDTVFGAESRYLEMYVRALPGDAGATATLTAPNVPLPAIGGLRLAIVADGGVAMVAVREDELWPREEVGATWLRVALPLRKAAAQTGGIRRLAFTTEAGGSLLIGRIAVVRDATPPTVEVLAFPAAAAVGEEVYFAARATTGLARPSITWDFDARDGVGVDAKGDRANWRFARAGEYRVTCTVQDADGGPGRVVGIAEVEATK